LAERGAKIEIKHVRAHVAVELATDRERVGPNQGNLVSAIRLLLQEVVKLHTILTIPPGRLIREFLLFLLFLYSLLVRYSKTIHASVILKGRMTGQNLDTIGDVWRQRLEMIGYTWRLLGHLGDDIYDLLEYKFIDMWIRPSVQPKLVVMIHN
jgi:hypothetical protein